MLAFAIPNEYSHKIYMMGRGIPKKVITFLINTPKDNIKFTF
jgi:hypothetical protein